MRCDGHGACGSKGRRVHGVACDESLALCSFPPVPIFQATVAPSGRDLINGEGRALAAPPIVRPLAKDGFFDFRNRGPPPDMFFMGGFPPPPQGLQILSVI